MEEVDLGFAEEREAAAQWLCNRYFPSKVGGRPAWLELEKLPGKQSLLCKKCGEPMSFLCQLYAPGEDEYNFHRSIYVFVCRDTVCQAPNEVQNFAVFRSQLPLKNDFYAEEPPAEDGEPEPEIEAKKKLCLACGCPGPFTCGRCRKANYCSLKHQRAMWPHHKLSCNQTTEQTSTMPATALDKIVFPELEIVIETNNDGSGHKSMENDANDEENRLKEFEDLAAQGKTGTFTNIPDAELEKYAQAADGADDKHFRRFKKAISSEPEQIIRYKRCGEPLWIADVEKTVATQLANIPKCDLCGHARKFEFQIMPQLLVLLKDEYLDWGVLAIYTCPKNCQIPKEIGYTQEHIVKQDIIGDQK